MCVGGWGGEGVGGESRCSGADSSALCILKPPSPPAAKIELEVEGVHGRRWEGGEERRERHHTPGSPFLIAPLASAYLIRHDQENTERVLRIDGAGQTGSNRVRCFFFCFFFFPGQPQSATSRQILDHNSRVKCNFFNTPLNSSYAGKLKQNLLILFPARGRNSDLSPRHRCITSPPGFYKNKFRPKNVWICDKRDKITHPNASEDLIIP